MSESFARLVDERIAAGVLRYSDRTALLEIAASLGIGRFQANLIIAAVQNLAGRASAAEQSNFPRGVRVTLLTIGLIQAMIVLAVWSICFR